MRKSLRKFGKSTSAVSVVPAVTHPYRRTIMLAGHETTAKVVSTSTRLTL